MRTAGRLAFFPARVAARASRDQLALAADDLVPEVVRVIDRAFATTLPEELVQSAVRHKVVERVARELVASGALDRAVNQALASEQMRRAIREVVESPELRAALARQTTGLAEELVGSVRARAVKLDGRLARIAAAPFAGIATRAVAFAIDAAAVILIWASISSMVAVIYFVLFWSGAGQTPGMRLLRLRLLGPSGRSPSVVRSLVRAVATVISIVPLFAGYLPVLFDERRRGLPDLLAGTVVAYEGRELESETWGTPAIG